MLFSLQYFSRNILNSTWKKKKNKTNPTKTFLYLNLNNSNITRKGLVGNLTFIFFLFNYVKKTYSYQSALPDVKKGYITKYGLKIYFYSRGLGIKPEWGDFIQINYVIYLVSKDDLVKIDSTYDRQKSFLFKHGSGQIISGIEEAIHNITQGSRIRIIIPNNLGYGKPGMGPIPPSSFKRDMLLREVNKPFETKYTLVMDIEIVSIIKNKQF